MLAPEVQEEARRLAAVARRATDGVALGPHRSRRPGGGSEFRDHRAYAPGDDPRHVDWRIAARSDRLMIKRFEADRQAEVAVIVDRSGSMDFGAPSKWSLARTLGLALAWIFLRQGDKVGLTAVGDAAVALPARGGPHWLDALSGACVAAPGGQADLAAALAERLAGRPLVVLISDLLDPGWQEPLRVHAARGREAWVVQVIDPQERDLPFDEPATFVGLEGEGELGLDPASVRDAYRAAWRAHEDGARRACLDAGHRYIAATTDVPPADALRALLEAP